MFQIKNKLLFKNQMFFSPPALLEMTTNLANCFDERLVLFEFENK